MSEYNKLAKRFAQEVKELQKSCPHGELSDWKVCEWGVGGNDNLKYEARYCKRCMAVIESRQKRG